LRSVEANEKTMRRCSRRCKGGVGAIRRLRGGGRGEERKREVEQRWRIEGVVVEGFKEGGGVGVGKSLTNGEEVSALRETGGKGKTHRRKRKKRSIWRTMTQRSQRVREEESSRTAWETV
jgi:hypothetical protein